MYELHLRTTQRRSCSRSGSKFGTLERPRLGRLTSFFDIRNQLNWDVSQRDDIKKQLNADINQYLANKNKLVKIEVESVDEKARVTIMIGDEISANEKGQLLMDLEIILRKQVHPAIQLYSMLYVDRNTKRKGHQWAINL